MCGAKYYKAFKATYVVSAPTIIENYFQFKRENIRGHK